jgi:hypothetical protein
MGPVDLRLIRPVSTEAENLIEITTSGWGGKSSIPSGVESSNGTDRKGARAECSKACRRALRAATIRRQPAVAASLDASLGASLRASLRDRETP